MQRTDRYLDNFHFYRRNAPFGVRDGINREVIMSNIGMFAVALLATTGLSSAAFALDQPANQSAVNHDFTKLSTDGLKAFQDVRLARVAIFDGQTKQAKTYVNEAKAEIAKAETDNTAFTKAEGDLKTPPAMAKPGANTGTPSATPIAWIPVDGTLTLDEDYTATPDKAKGVATANEKLQNGQSKDAMAALKLAQVNAVLVTELAPMESTMTGIDKAAQLIDAGQYYQGNQALKGVEDGIRFDTVDMTGLPKETPKNPNATASTASTAPTASAAAPSGK
jgi:hypothetical protein